MAWLDEHPPRRSQFRRPRRAPLSGVIVVHTAENTPDHVAFDGGAEAVARFIQNREDAGSYHDIVDSDSAIHLVDYDAEAFHDGTGSNPHSLGLSIATRADVWPLAPQAWRDGAIEQAARRAAEMARHVHERTGVTIPPRRITRAESEARTPGFISHAERDPARRTDPGRDFPWSQFLGRFAALAGAPSNPEVDDMAAPYYLVQVAGDPRVFATDGLAGTTHVPNPDVLAYHQYVLGAGGHDNSVHIISSVQLEGLLYQARWSQNLATVAPGSDADAIVDELAKRLEG